MKRLLLNNLTLWLAALTLFSLNPALLNAQGSLKPISYKKVEYTSGDLRDPFESPLEMLGDLDEPTPTPKPKQPVKIEYGLEHLQMQGIVWGSKFPQAIINNKVVRIGESVEGAEVLDIRKEGVYVLYQGRQYILRTKRSKAQGAR